MQLPHPPVWWILRRVFRRIYQRVFRRVYQCVFRDGIDGFIQRFDSQYVTTLWRIGIPIISSFQ